jgi:hypothetical protein
MDYPIHELPMEEYRLWRLCSLLHCRPSELEEESALELDWLLAVDKIVKEFKAEKEAEANAR